MPIVGLKLIVLDKLAQASKAKAVFVAQDPAITKGAGTDPLQIMATLDAGLARSIRSLLLLRGKTLR